MGFPRIVMLVGAMTPVSTWAADIPVLPVPTLGAWGIAGLAAALVVLAVRHLRNRDK